MPHFFPSKQFYKVGGIINPILHMRKVRQSYLGERNLSKVIHRALAKQDLNTRFSDFKILLPCFTGTPQRQQELSESFQDKNQLFKTGLIHNQGETSQRKNHHHFSQHLLYMDKNRFKPQYQCLRKTEILPERKITCKTFAVFFTVKMHSGMSSWFQMTYSTSIQLKQYMQVFPLASGRCGADTREIFVAGVLTKPSSGFMNTSNLKQLVVLSFLQKFLTYNYSECLKKSACRLFHK